MMVFTVKIALQGHGATGEGSFIKCCTTPDKRTAGNVTSL